MTKPPSTDKPPAGLKIFTFVIHVWREEDASKPAVWRGSLTNVSNGEKKYFQSLPGLMKVVSKFIGSTGAIKGGRLKK